jgi:hypothetical protein
MGPWSYPVYDKGSPKISRYLDKASAKRIVKYKSEVQINASIALVILCLEVDRRVLDIELK